MNPKRLAISFASVVVLLVVAGALELIAAVLPPASGEDALPPGEQAAVAETTSGPLRARSARAAAVEKRVAELVEAGNITVDGEPLGREQAETLVGNAVPYAGAVEHIDQLSTLPSGCEIIALAVALRAEGFDASPVDIAENNLIVEEGDFSTSYAGSPWRDGGGFPACIADAGNSWLLEHGEQDNARVHDLTGTTFAGIAELVALGYPVLAWTTEDLADPRLTDLSANGLRWYFPEHCVVVCGVEGGEVLVSDSLVGLVKRDRAAFERIYGECGNMAVLVQPQ